MLPCFIGDADPALVTEAGMYADRVSINVELPTEGGLKKLAPEKRMLDLVGFMRHTSTEQLVGIGW